MYSYFCQACNQCLPLLGYIPGRYVLVTKQEDEGDNGCWVPAASSCVGVGGDNRWRAGKGKRLNRMMIGLKLGDALPHCLPLHGHCHCLKSFFVLKTSFNSFLCID